MAGDVSTRALGIESLLAPADRLRGSLLRAVGPALRPWLVSRERRIALGGALLMLVAFAGTLGLPLWYLALGPIIWGIPHVLSDVRYLVVRPGHHRRPMLVLLVMAGLVLAGAGLGLRGGLVAVAGALLAARAPWSRRLAGLALVCGLLGLAQWAGWVGDLVFAHVHNFVAIFAFWAWRKRDSRLHWLPISVFLLAALGISLGAFDTIFAYTSTLAIPLTTLDVPYFHWTLATRMPAPFASRLLLLFAFAQAAHYVVWVRLVPEEARPSKTPRSFTQTWRALRADMGRIVVYALAAGMLALAAWAALDLRQAREGYLRFAFFHGYLELAAFALLWCERRSLGSVCPQTSTSEREAPAQTVIVAPGCLPKRKSAPHAPRGAAL